MKVICTDGLVLECENFTAVDGGVVLTEDVKRKRNSGFVPMRELRYVVPDDAVPDDEAWHAENEWAKRTVPAPGWVDSTSELQRINGLGPTYAKRLRGAGVRTLSELAAKHRKEIASAADVSEARAETWIERAGDMA